MSTEGNGDGKGVMPSAFLLAAVVLVMVTGRVLKTDVSRSLARAPGPASPAPSLPLGSTISPEFSPVAPSAIDPATEVEQEPVAESTPAETADPLADKLAARVEVDCGRLAKSSAPWTAQLLVACKPETVDRILGMAQGSNSLYVLPVQVKGDACFRLCYGTYQTQKNAALAADLPRALRGKERIGAILIAKVLP